MSPPAPTARHSDMKTESGARLLGRSARPPSLRGLHPVLFPEGPGRGRLVELAHDRGAPGLVLYAELIKNAVSSGAGAIVIATEGRSESDFGNPPPEALSRLRLVHTYDRRQTSATLRSFEAGLAHEADVSLIAIESPTDEHLNSLAALAEDYNAVGLYTLYGRQGESRADRRFFVESDPDAERTYRVLSGDDSLLGRFVLDGDGPRWLRH